PRLRRIHECLLQLHKLGQIIVIEGIGFAEVTAGIELVIPDLPRGSALVEEEHHSLHTCTLKRAAGTVEHSMQVAAFQQKLAQVYRSIVAIREERILDDHAAAPAGLEHLD